MERPIKIIFMGSAAFACPSLEALLAHKEIYEVMAVFSQPPRKAGRGKKITPTPIHQLAIAHALTCYTPESLKTEAVRDLIASFKADLLIVIAYGLLLPLNILQAVHYGAVNLHGSLLPKWRGAAPIQRAIAAGDQLSGVSLMQMAVGLDDGPIIASSKMPILEDDNTPSLMDKLAQAGAELLTASLPSYIKGDLTPIPQDHQQATYAKKIFREDATIDFTKAAQHYERTLRGFTPFPSLQFYFKGQMVQLKKLTLVHIDNAPPRQIIELNPLIIACAQDALCLDEIQLPNKGTIKGYEFAQQFSLQKGAFIV